MEVKKSLIKKSWGETRCFEKFTQNLTELARLEKLILLLGEIRWGSSFYANSFSSYQKQSCSCWRSRSRETAIAEGLAQRIISGDVPETLRDKELLVARYGRIGGEPNSVESLKSVWKPCSKKSKNLMDALFFYWWIAYHCRCGSRKVLWMRGIFKTGVGARTYPSHWRNNTCRISKIYWKRCSTRTPFSARSCRWAQHWRHHCHSPWN